MPTTVPDRVFALGGAGKEITLNLLDTDWVLREVLAPRPNPESMTVRILDTAEGEANQDRQRIRDIENRIEELKSELQDIDRGRVGDIDIQYKIVTENIQLDEDIDLVGDDVVPRITQQYGMDPENWWLRGDHIVENLDFARGVVRRRGLGKAVYYKAYAEDDSMRSFVDLPERGSVAIVAGLGGGTGSGTFIDLAEHIRDRVPTAEVSLFSVLPNHTEGAEESSNAYAALSELEYMSLSDEKQIFEDIVLFPIDPTGFEGKKGDRLQSDSMLQEFDDAFTYALLAYYNNEFSENPFEDTPDYAPFTIAVPQALRYNVEAINESRESLREMLDAKRDALDAEDQLYSKIERFLTNHYPSVDDESLRELDRTDLEERLEEVEESLSFELFNELEYQSRAVFDDVLSDARREGDSVVEQVDIAAASANTFDPTGPQIEDFVDTIDERLGDLLKRELKLLQRRKEILVRKKAIDDSQVRGAVEYLIDADDGNSVAAGVKVQRLESELEDLREQREDAESDLEEARERLETEREKQSEAVRRDVRDWADGVRDTFERYQRLQNASFDSSFREVRKSLEDYLREINSAESVDEVDQASQQEVINALDGLERDLNQVGVDFGQHRRDVTEAMNALADSRKAFLLMNQEESTLEKWSPITTSSEQEREQASQDWNMAQNSLGDTGVFDLSPSSSTYDATLVFEDKVEPLRRDIDEKDDRLRADILEGLRSALEDPGAANLGRVETLLDRGATMDELREEAHDVFAAQVAGTGDIKERVDEIEDDLDDLDSRLESYEAVKEVFDDLINPRSTYLDNRETYHRLRQAHDEEESQSVGTTESDEYVYIKTVQPQDVLRLRAEDGIGESRLFSNKQEKQRLRMNLEDLVGNALQQQYNGLNRRKFSGRTSRYNDMNIRVAVLSNAAEEIREVADFRDDFSEAFSLQSSRGSEHRFGTWDSETGGDWDIGVTTFIDGVFLDNIRKLTQAGGYATDYRRREEELGNMVVHHNYGLQDGFYVRRGDLLNLERDEDREFLVNNSDAEISNRLLGEFIDVVPLNDDNPDLGVDPEPEQPESPFDEDI